MSPFPLNTTRCSTRRHKQKARGQSTRFDTLRSLGAAPSGGTGGYSGWQRRVESQGSEQRLAAESVCVTELAVSVYPRPFWNGSVVSLHAETKNSACHHHHNNYHA